MLVDNIISATHDSWFAQDTAYLDVKHKIGDNVVRYKCCHEKHYEKQSVSN